MVDRASTGRRLRITVSLDPRRCRRWHAGLIADLAGAGHELRILHENGPPPQSALDWVMLLERLLRRRHGPHPAEQIAALPPTRDEVGAFDLLLDLTGDEPQKVSARRLAPLWDGQSAEEAALAALLAGRIPTLGLDDSMHPDRRGGWNVAVEDPTLLTAAFDQLCARMRRLVLAGVRAVAAGDDLPSGGVVAGRSNRTSTPAVLATALRWQLTRLLNRGAPHWFVGWRRCEEAASLWEMGRLPPAGYARLPDDGQRFYADPILGTWDGRTVLFLEEFVYATGKGLLSWVEVGPEGPRGTPRPFMEVPHHLSYPFVFEDGGTLWMVPETSAARRIELFRCVAFPDRWEPVATLVADVEAADATIVHHDGRYHMLATAGGDGTSSWDALHHWTAERLTGPWIAASPDPVLIDARCARPAGPFHRRRGELWRPAQDCSGGYGGALGLARIRQLDAAGFAQTVETVLRPGPPWPGIGLHTLHWHGGLEVVDGCERR